MISIVIYSKQLLLLLIQTLVLLLLFTIIIISTIIVVISYFPLFSITKQSVDVYKARKQRPDKKCKPSHHSITHFPISCPERLQEGTFKLLLSD